MRNTWLGNVALGALLAAAQPAWGQVQAPVPAAPAAPDDTAQDAPPSDIIVTGSARQQRRFDVSYAVNSLGQDDIRKLAPKSMTDLITGRAPALDPHPYRAERFA